MLRQRLIGPLLLCAGLACAQDKTLESYYEEAHRAFQRGDFKVARDALRTLLTLRNDIPEAHSLMGVIQDQLGNKEQARDHFETALRLKPDLIDARSNLALFLIKQNDLKGALQLATSDFTPGDVYFLVVTAFRQKKDYGRALEQSLWMTQHFPTFAKAYLYAATELQFRGELERATALYQKTLALSISQPGISLAAKFGLADTLSKQGRYSEAIPLLEEIIRANKRDTDARLELGSILLRTGRYEEGARLLQETVALDPQNRKAHFLLGSTLTRLGKQQEAATHLRLFEDLERRENQQDNSQPTIYTKSRE
jgi:protein O-GlcNAc transferase